MNFQTFKVFPKQNFKKQFLNQRAIHRKQLETELRSKQKMEHEAQDLTSLRQRLLERDHELQTMTSLRQQAVSEADRLKDMMRDLRSDAEAARGQAQRAQADAER